jgi:hypothetical protein
MRTSQWTLLLTALMFIASVWFVLASARTSGRTATSAPAATVSPVASVQQLMTGIVSPASTVVYESVSVVVSAEGEKENYPKTAAEWNKVAGSAAAIAEAGALLMVPGRAGARDTDGWRTMSKAMIDASLVSRKAAEGHDKDALLASGEALNNSCDACHRTYDVP